MRHLKALYTPALQCHDDSLPRDDSLEGLWAALELAVLALWCAWFKLVQTTEISSVRCMADLFTPTM